MKVSQAQAETTRAQLENARWDLTQTTLLAPGNGTMVNVMLRPGFFVAGMPFNEVMTFVDDEYQIFALFGQNELHQVAPGNEAEITLDTYPGRIIKAHVDSIIWAQGQGQVDASGDLPRTTFVAPPGRFPVKLVVGEQDHALFLAAGARGSAAIYTEHLSAIHILRKVLMRVAVVPRLHHHQAQHQPALMGMVMPDLVVRVARSRLRAAFSLAAAAIGLLLTSACALKSPPDAAAIKAEAMPTVAVPAAWTAAGAGAGAVADNWLATLPRRSAGGRGRRSDRQQRRPARRARRASSRRCCTRKLAGAKLYPSVDVLARGGGKMSGDSSRPEGRAC